MPHVVVLSVLWAVFAVLTVVAGVCILVTGRYPRGLFDVNVGVLRWTWRVGHYGYLTLRHRPLPAFHPARHRPPREPRRRLPGAAARPLVLVKWLLAVPHLLIVEILLGAVSRFGPTKPPVYTAGLLGVLVLAAGVGLTVLRRYPAGLFDLDASPPPVRPSPDEPRRPSPAAHPQRASRTALGTNRCGSELRRTRRTSPATIGSDARAVPLWLEHLVRAHLVVAQRVE